MCRGTLFSSPRGWWWWCASGIPRRRRRAGACFFGAKWDSPARKATKRPLLGASRNVSPFVDTFRGGLAADHLGLKESKTLKASFFFFHPKSQRLQGGARPLSVTSCITGAFLFFNKATPQRCIYNPQRRTEHSASTSPRPPSQPSSFSLFFLLFFFGPRTPGRQVSY